MESNTVFLCIGIFTLCVSAVGANDCLTEGSQCMTRFSSIPPDTNNLLLLCKTVSEAVTCIETAKARCATQEHKNILDQTKAPLGLQHSAFCTTNSCAPTELMKCYPSNFKPDQPMTPTVESCKMMVPVLKCLKEIPSRCPDLKPTIDAMVMGGENEAKGCEKLLSVGTNECISEGSQCMTSLSSTPPDPNNPPLFCKNVKEAVTCIETAKAKCKTKQQKDQLDLGKTPLEQQYNSICASCTPTELSNCYPSNFRPEQQKTPTVENCKIIMPALACIKEIPKRCPNMKTLIDGMVTSGENEVKACENLLSDSQAKTTKEPNANKGQPKDMDVKTAEGNIDTKPKGSAIVIHGSTLLWIVTAVLMGGFLYV